MTCDSCFPFLQVQLAEMEALSLNSDKSSSILLGDESDNHSTSQLSPKEIKVSPRRSWACCTMCCISAPAHLRCSVFIQVSLLRNINSGHFSRASPPRHVVENDLRRKKGCVFLKVLFATVSDLL